jgi:Ca2+-binding RTX toxin-like protein
MDTNGISKAGRVGVVAGAAAALALGLATAAPAGAATPAQADDDTLTIRGSNRGEQIVLRLAAGNPGTLDVDFGGDGTAERSFDRATFSRIEVLARGGRDQVRIDEGNGAFADEEIAIDGGSGADTIDGGSGNELLVGGRGGDTVDGNGGADTGVLGSGRDTFRWDPGDGSDVVEGRSGVDTLDFNGAGAAENMSFTANGRRTLFFRDVGNIRMDMDDVEALDLTTLGGNDTVTVGDMSGTDARFAGIDLSGPAGGPDGLADTVTVTGSRRGDDIEVDTRRGRVEVDGLRAEVEIAGAEPADSLSILAGDGNDEVEVDDDVEDVIGVTVDLGPGQR